MPNFHDEIPQSFTVTDPFKGTGWILRLFRPLIYSLMSVKYNPESMKAKQMKKKSENVGASES